MAPFLPKIWQTFGQNGLKFEVDILKNVAKIAVFGPK